MRTSSIELPSADEIRAIINEESPRLAVHRDYLSTRPWLFMELSRVAAQAGIDAAVFEKYQAWDFNKVVGALHVFVSECSAYLAQHIDDIKAEQLYEPLKTGNSPKQSDIIFVFGSAKNMRIAKAVELYHSGVASKIMATGAAPRWAASQGENNITEAQRMADYAITHGVPADDIIIEDQAISIPDNVKRSIDLWEAMQWYPQRITLVTSEFNVRRAEMNIYEFTPWPVEIFIASPEPSSMLRADTWIETERGRRLILNEYAKLIIESAIDHLLAAKGKI